jgi:hypothetical protein
VVGDVLRFVTRSHDDRPRHPTRQRGTEYAVVRAKANAVYAEAYVDDLRRIRLSRTPERQTLPPMPHLR